MVQGRLMIDLQGLEVNETEKEMLAHPNVGGLILFTRNYESPEQITRLIEVARESTQDALLVAVDHEGGRVQRFREGFTQLPPVSSIQHQYAHNRDEGLMLAEQAGWLMAAEVRAIGVDISFAPVLDVDWGVSQVIGERAFHSDPQTLTDIASAYINGMNRAGMRATGKHFPGHGGIQADSHVSFAEDPRDWEALQADLQPFVELIQQQKLDAVMAAHLIYPQLCKQAAGFSSFWLTEILRTRFQFDGAIFSDDLSMHAASIIGKMEERVKAAIHAGCDMALVCNDPDAVAAVLDAVSFKEDARALKRLNHMRGRAFMNRSALLSDDAWRQSVQKMSQLA